MKLTELATYSFPLNILNYVLEICQKMSITNKGYTIVIIKDAELKYSSPLLSDCQFSATKLNHLKDTEVMKLAALDGALILNINNIILGVGQRLEPPSETVYVKEPGRGSRHDSAAKYTGAIDCVVFVVSENGPITIFFKGDKFARCYQEIFGYQ
jgi:DNA integrity scanning protein DisA with diadenylate cyclase activity